MQQLICSGSTIFTTDKRGLASRVFPRHVHQTRGDWRMLLAHWHSRPSLHQKELFWHPRWTMKQDLPYAFVGKFKFVFLPSRRSGKSKSSSQQIQTQQKHLFRSTEQIELFPSESSYINKYSRSQWFNKSKRKFWSGRFCTNKIGGTIKQIKSS